MVLDIMSCVYMFQSNLHINVYSVEDGSEIESHKSSVTTSVTATPVKVITYFHSSSLLAPPILAPKTLSSLLFVTKHHRSVEFM